MDFKQRLEQNRGKLDNAEELSEPEDDFVYFATGNTQNLPACLDLRLSQGKRKALPYSFFTELNFDSEEGIEILTPREKIKIIGRNLTKLFDYLVNYRVRYIQASIGNDPKEDGLFVSEIIIEDIV